MALVEIEGSAVPEWTLGDRLRKAREHAGLEQKDLATALEVSEKSIGRWENGGNIRDWRTIVPKWSRATGVPASWLLGDPGQNWKILNVDLHAVSSSGQMQLALDSLPPSLELVH